MIVGRIGKYARIHRVMKFAVPSGRAVSRCGKAGRALLVADGVISCAECLAGEPCTEPRWDLVQGEPCPSPREDPDASCRCAADARSPTAPASRCLCANDVPSDRA